MSEALSRHDFVCLIEDADDVSPWREPEEKIDAIERFDAGFMSSLLKELSGPCRILVAVDCGFRVESQEWAADAAPFAMADFDGENFTPPKRPGGLAALWEMIRGGEGRQKNSDPRFFRRNWLGPDASIQSTP